MNRHVSRLVAMIRRWFGGGTRDRTLDAELDSFLEHEIDARIEGGMTREEARRTARASLGGVQQVKEQARDARMGASLDALWRDARYAARTVRRSTGLSLAIVGSLAVGIAVTVVAYAFLNAWLFRDLPGVTDQERLVSIYLTRSPAGNPTSTTAGTTMNSAAEYQALQTGLAALSDVAAATGQRVALQLPEPHSVVAFLVSGNYFDVVGARASAGRTFHPDESQASNAAVAVISHSFWRRALNSDPMAIGRTIRVGGELVQIVGVAPPGFVGTRVQFGREGPDIWLPLALADRVAPDAATALRPGGLSFVARLKPGVEVPEFIAATTALASNHAAEVASQHGSAMVSGLYPDPEFGRCGSSS